MKVLVTGGAGYIGSHAVKRLLAAGHQPVVLDDYSRGHRAAVPENVPRVHASTADANAVERALVENEIECVLHFAAFAYVGESVEKPLEYYQNNTGGSLSLLSAMRGAGVERLVFSSTCATYGEPEQMPITEETPQTPVNPYGWSKLFVEQMLRDTARAQPSFGFTSLRYFNVAGCALDGSLGEHHDPETHIIPVILQAALGKREKVTVFGDDYPTPDGTCIRDYIHVDDLIDAHIQAMQTTGPGTRSFYNLGIGRGYSVREVVEAARAVVARDFKVEIGPRRPGDPPELYSDAGKIARELGWTAQVTDIHQIIESAWRWFREHPDGYSS
ncbi:MAG TPA: UDP-glucose 4-epimerase GalE [Polyangiaceae bacterium]